MQNLVKPFSYQLIAGDVDESAAVVQMGREAMNRVWVNGWMGE